MNNSQTKEFHEVFEKAYSFFNEKLFDNKLPGVIIVPQRKGKTNLGYFHPERFIDRIQMQKAITNKGKGKSKKTKLQTVSELSLNPDNFLWRSDIEILSTLVHEMCHAWQYYEAEKKSRNGYHDKIWGRKIKDVGLYPSNTGEKDGKETGQQMTHYIIKGGTFEILAKEFLKTEKLLWNSLPIPSKSSSKKDKTKYICPSCGDKLWGKPGMNVQCMNCEETAKVRPNCSMTSSWCRGSWLTGS